MSTVLAIIVAVLGAVVLALPAILFAWRETRRVRLLLGQAHETQERLAGSAAHLSSASEQLAATTTEQSAAVTQTTATMEELARTSASISETMVSGGQQAVETREALEAAEAEIRASSERTLELAARVDEIGEMLELINEIADQTNLLALNAAIEAARAGEGGRGFAVVAEEVRRLAERSKSSAAHIGGIIEGITAETNATVMAMEQSTKQMQRGLDLVDRGDEARAQVQLTIQQQRAATDQVVDTMEQLTDSSRQVADAAKQMASSAAELVSLAEALDRVARQAGARG